MLLNSIFVLSAYVMFKKDTIKEIIIEHFENAAIFHMLCWTGLALIIVYTSLIYVYTCVCSAKCIHGVCTSWKGSDTISLKVICVIIYVLLRCILYCMWCLVTKYQQFTYTIYDEHDIIINNDIRLLLLPSP